MHDSLSQFQHVNLFEENGYDKLLKAIDEGIKRKQGRGLINDPIPIDTERELIRKYEGFFHSKNPDTENFKSISNDLLKMTKSLFSKFEDAGKIENSEYLYNKKIGEIKYILDDLDGSLDAYGDALNHAYSIKDNDLIFNAAIMKACISAFNGNYHMAIYNFNQILPHFIDNYGINLYGLIETTMRICFYENYDIVNPLKLVFKDDSYRLKLRVQRLADSLFETLKKNIDDPNTILLEFSELLEKSGAIMPAIKYYKFAQEKNLLNANEKLKEVENTLSMAKSFAGESTEGMVGDNNSASFSPKTLRRIMMCLGINLDVESIVNENITAVHSGPSYLQNDIVPTTILIYEDYLDSTSDIREALTYMSVGWTVVRKLQDAQTIIDELSEMRLFICDHRKKVLQGGLGCMTSLIFERDHLKIKYPDVVSILLTMTPYDNLSKGFMKGGGDYLVDSRNKTVGDITEDILNIYDQT